MQITKRRWLISWIGAADHECAESKRGADHGPVATALLADPGFDRVHLLTNYDFNRSREFCVWLAGRSGYDSAAIELHQVDLASPIDYAAIYRQVSLQLRHAGLPHDDVELTFHASPGTPAMAAIWIMLAKTRFPAKLIQTSKESGLMPIDFDFDLAGDFLPEYLRRASGRVNRLAITPNSGGAAFDKIIHQCPQVDRQILLARRIAAYEVPALILGETGTGKELFAEAMHAASARASHRFVAVNCGAMTPELANSELFGHKKGAFTGATSDRKGLFVEASDGTLFLDEVGDLPLDTQVRLLRALQSKEVTPLGQSVPVKVNTRIVAATHRNLAQEVAQGRFREDLYHRLAVGIIQLPPLRERAGDIELLALHFLGLVNADAAGRPEAQRKRFGPESIRALRAHSWPGNIRELYHTVVRAVIWSTDAEITADDVHDALLPLVEARHVESDLVMGQGFRLQDKLDQVARAYISQALQSTGHRTSGAARMLGFSNQQTLSNWMKRLGLASEQ